MSKAYEIGMLFETRKNESTTTMPAYTIVRLCTTINGVDLITTAGTMAYGVTQEAINPSDTGKIAICSSGGISRVKMASTAYTTAHMATTRILIQASANGRGRRATSTTVCAIGIPLSTWAASDIIPVALIPPAKYKL